MNLKPCPFCGSDPRIIETTVVRVETEKADYKEWVVVCSVCGAHSGNSSKKDLALEFWNRRKEERREQR